MAKERQARHRLEVAKRVVGRIAHSELTHVFDSWHLGVQKEREARHRLEVGNRVVARMGHAELVHGFDQWVAGTEKEREAREEAGRADHLAELRGEISSHQVIIGTTLIRPISGPN